MKLKRSVIIPVVAAILVVGAIAVALSWKVLGVNTNILAQLSNLTKTTVTLPDFNPVPDNPGDRALLHLRRGDLAAMQGEWQEATDEYEEAVEAQGGLPALRKLAGAQLQRRDIHGARASLDALRRAGASSDDMLLLETLIHLRSGELDQAERLLSNADPSPQKSYGQALLAIVKRDDEAAKLALTEVMNGSEPTLREFATTLKAAYDEYALFQQSPASHLSALLGHALAQVQECELALPLLSSATQETPDYRDAWIVRGYCESSTERTAEAVRSLEEAYRIDPEQEGTQFLLGRAYAAEGNHRLAVTYLGYAVENGFTPEQLARRWLAREALQVGDTQLALAQYDALTQSITADREVFDATVQALLAANQKEAAITKAEAAVSRWPDDARAYLLLGKALAASDKSTEAKQAFNKALEIEPNLQEAKEANGEL